MFRVTREFEFCFGHRLKDYDGKCRQIHGHNGKACVTLEADTLDQVRAFLKLNGVDWILLDNMPRPHLREAVALVRALPPEKRVKLEASGGVTIETVRPIAETGVDYVSVGALTHSAKALDLSLELARDSAAG